jgi:hypothetical protein
MNQSETTITFSEEERKQFKIEMRPILEKHSKEEIEVALHQLKKSIVV